MPAGSFWMVRANDDYLFALTVSAHLQLGSYGYVFKERIVRDKGFNSMPLRAFLVGPALFLVASLSGCTTAGTKGMTPPAAEVAFERYEVVVGFAERQTVLTGFLLGGAVAELAVVNIGENDDRRLRIYARGDGAWAPILDEALRPEVLFVDVANIGGRDRLITYEPGRLNWFDPESAMERALVAVTSNFNPPDEGEIPHVDITRDVNSDDRDDLVVPDVDGFWVFIQMGDGAFADPVKLGPSTKPYVNARDREHLGKWHDGPREMAAWYVCEKADLDGCSDAGWSAFEGFCYAVSEQLKNYDDAAMACEAQAAQLVSIQSAEVNAHVTSLCKRRSCWIGLSEPADSEHWFWADGAAGGTKGEWVGYVNWEKGEPNNYRGRDQEATFMNYWEHLGMPAPWQQQMMQTKRSVGTDGYRYDPWAHRRVHEMDYDLDGRNDLVFWNEDHFEVHTQDERGLFAPVAEIFTTDVAFDSDDPASLAGPKGFRQRRKDHMPTGEMTGRVLHSLTDMNGDGVADLVVFSLEIKSMWSAHSNYEVHFGKPTPDSGTVFAPDVGTAIQSGVPFGVGPHDFDHDGEVDMMFTTINVGLFKAIGMIAGALLTDSVTLDLEFYRMEGGIYPDKPNATRKTKMVSLGKSGEKSVYPAVLIGDVNGDNRSDLLVQNGREALHVFIGVPGPDLFARLPQKVAVAMPNEEYTLLVDLNKDGKQDVLMHHPSTTESHRVTMLIAR